ncbi:hypothetical protein ACO2Q1_10195 [Brevundimonas sp. VNH65]|uniref:hypothetical protein n=1 Tax=Brevundimonas sp. VNH65 TaxID=3400917 RepID=UPI003C127FCF
MIDLLADLLGPDSAPLKPLAPSARPVTPADPETACMGRVSEATLAQLLGLTAGRIRQLQQDGVFQRVGRKDESFDIAASVRAYCDFMRDSVKRQGSTDELKAEKVRQAKAAAEKLEIANAKSRGELVPVAEVRAAWADLLRDVRAGLLAVPSRCGAELATKLAAEDVAVIDREIRLALERLADDR